MSKEKIKSSTLIRFYPTTNVGYPMVYDSKTHCEYTNIEDLLPLLNGLNLRTEKIKKIIEDSGIMECECYKHDNNCTGCNIQKWFYE